jgi:hypothetical protein
MIQRANKSSFLRLELEGTPNRSSPFEWPYSVKTRIRIPLHSPLFRDLFLTLSYTAHSARGPITNLSGELSDIGWGISGLLPADTHLSLSSWQGRIDFEITCSIELKIGSLEKDGLSIPMPFPKHQGMISGW